MCTLQKRSQTLATDFESLNYGPLTTIFTPATSCLTDYYSDGFIFLGNPYDMTAAATHDCYPSKFFDTAYASTYLPFGWYSPGVCPSGWIAAKTATTRDPGLDTYYSDLGWDVPPIPGETTIQCCPSGFNVPNNYSSINLQCSRYTGHINVTSCAVVAGESGCLSWNTTSFSDPVSVIAPVMIAKYRASDLPLLQRVSPLWGTTASSLTNSSMSSLISSSTNFASSPTSPSLPSQTITPPLDPSRLSQTTELAIGITIPISFILLLASVFIFFRRRKWKKSKDQSVETKWQKPELSAEQAEYRQLEAELSAEHAILHTLEQREEVEGDSIHRVELPAVSRPVEMQ